MPVTLTWLCNTMLGFWDCLLLLQMGMPCLHATKLVQVCGHGIRYKEGQEHFSLEYNLDPEP